MLFFRRRRRCNAWVQNKGALLTFGGSWRETLQGRIPKNYKSMAFLWSRPLEPTKRSVIQIHAKRSVGILWVVGNYLTWRLHEKGPKQQWPKILSMSGLNFGRERFIQLEVALGTLNVYHVWLRCGLADPIQEWGDFWQGGPGIFFCRKIGAERHGSSI